MPDELWTEVHDIVQETGIKTAPKKKKYKKAKWLSEEALQRAVQRRVLKGKKERKDTPIWMQSFKDLQGERRKPSSAISEFSKPGFSNTWTVNFQIFKLVLEKAEEPEIKLSTSVGSSKKQEFQKNIYFYFIDYAKAFDCVDHNKLENSERDGNTRPPDLPPEKSVCRSGSNG